jgi:hypothetical protein
MDGRYVRGRAFNLSLLASSLAQQGEIEQACAVGGEAVALTRSLSSARAVRYVSGLVDQLQPYAGRPDVRRLAVEAQPLISGV